MDKARFWQLIVASRKRAQGSMEAQVRELSAALAALPPPEIEQFQRIFYEHMDAAFHWDLWGAAYIIGEGCSDEDFIDFRAWLISMGPEVYSSALQSAEHLADLAARDDIEDFFFEEFNYVPGQVYEERTGSEMPFIDRQVRSEPEGEPWDEDESVLPQRFPRLWAAFGAE